MKNRVVFAYNLHNPLLYIKSSLGYLWASRWLSGLRIHLPMQETWVNSLGWEDPLEEEIATHSNIFAWRIPRTEEPGGYSPWDRKKSDTTESLSRLVLDYL